MSKLFRSGWRFITCAGCLLMASPAWAQTIVTLSFDDTYAEHWEAARRMERYGMRGTFYVNRPRLDRRGYMSTQDVLNLQTRGHDVGGHTCHHPNLAKLVEQDIGELTRQICDDRAGLLSLGINARNFAYPFGANNAQVQQVVASCGYSTAREVGDLRHDDSCFSCPVAETVPPENVMRLRTLKSMGKHITLASYQQAIMDAERLGEPGWVILVMHHIGVANEAYSIDWETYDALLSWLAARGSLGTQVQSVAQVVQADTQPGMWGPPPAGRQAWDNMLLNGGLDYYHDSEGSDVPDCWRRAGWGDNTYSWWREDEGPGNYAQTVTIDSWQEGARRLISKQDLGACAPLVEPGSRYRLRVNYRATALTYFMIYYRNSDGSWRDWARSPNIAPTTRFHTVTWDTPPLPPDAVAASVGLSITHQGTLTVDDFRLTQMGPYTPLGALHLDGGVILPDSDD